MAGSIDLYVKYRVVTNDPEPLFRVVSLDCLTGDAALNKKTYKMFKEVMKFKRRSFNQERFAQWTKFGIILVEEA